MIRDRATFASGSGESLANLLEPFYLSACGTSLRPESQEGKPVEPADLLNYRANHEFRAPCCLCASISNPHTADYTESAIYIADNGPYWAEYVAGCASNSCGYLGTLRRVFY